MEELPAKEEPATSRPFWRELFGMLPWGILYLLTMTENFSAAHDSIAYLNQLELDPNIHYYSHHLLWHPLMAWWISLWPESIAVFTRIEVLHAISGMLLMMIFFSIARKRLGLDRRIAAAATAIPAVSYGIWCYSTTVEVYIIPLCALLASLYWMTQPTLRWKSVLLSSAFLALAIVFHQSHILFIPVLLLSWYWNRKALPMSWKKAIGASFATLAVLVGIPYLSIMLGPLDLKNLGDMGHWLVGYAHDSSYWADPGLSMLTEVVVGAGRSFIGGQFAFALPGLAKATASTGFGLSDEAFLVRELSGTWLWVMIFASGIFVVWFLSNVLGIGKRWTEASKAHQLFARILLTALGCYSVFFFFWVPVNPEFWLPQLLFICLLLARFRLFPHRIWLALPAYILGMINFWGSIAPMQDPSNDLYDMEARAIAVFAGENDRIIVSQSWIRSEYIRRYAGAELTSLPVWIGEGHTEAELLEQIDADLVAFKQVILTQDAISYGLMQDAENPWWKPLQNRWQKQQTPTGNLYIVLEEGIKE